MKGKIIMRPAIHAAACLVALAGMPASGSERATLAPGARNPILPGYFADPSIVQHDGEWFIYATMDPWGGDKLAMWRSRDFRNWTFSTPEWPTKAAATSPTSGDSKVWAPSVVKAQGRYWMYVSVGSEVWVGSAPSPAGPWHDANGGRPLIPGNYRPGYHMIDAEAFIDDDGQAYLYWGSGLNWINGRCFVVRLKPDMTTFDGEPVDVTPPHYFEAPFMFKRNGHYFLTYSWGNTTKDTYQVRYAVGSSPLGPFREPTDKPLLETDKARQVISPGHHAIFSSKGEDFILYHRQALPFVEGGEVRRQVAVDRLRVRGDRLDIVTPTADGPDVPGTTPRRAVSSIRPAAITASSADAGHGASSAADDNYATSWRASKTASLTIDMGTSRHVSEVMLRPGAPSTPLSLEVQVSDKGSMWRKAVKTSPSGSPVTLKIDATARFLKIILPKGGEIMEVAIRP